MNARKLVAVTLLVLPMVAIGTGRAPAQVATSPGQFIQPQVIETTFPFEIAGGSLPAGKYDIEQPARDLLVFRPANGKGRVIEAPVITRLAKPAVPLAEPYVVFDKVNDTYYISEVWLPGEDGFLLGGIKEEHTHQKVKAIKKK
jgi:hypothetical protein